MLSLALGMQTRLGPLQGSSWGMRGGRKCQRQCEPAGVLVMQEWGQQAGLCVPNVHLCARRHVLNLSFGCFP